jgi:predicted permease
MNAEDEIREELETHLRAAIAERMAHGESREDAERAARREFGNLTHVSEVTREQTYGAIGIWLERLAQDVRYGLRALRRTPAFTLTAVSTLAIAIGANSAVFTVVNGVLLRPLPFLDADRLVLASYLPPDLPFEPPPGLADRQWLAYRERQHSFSAVGAYVRRAATLSGAGDAVRLTGARVEPEVFAALQVPPIRGRTFSREERDVDNVAVLSSRLWHERFGSDPRVLGSSISLDGVPTTVIGVMPAGFGFPAESDFWTPLTVQLNARNSFILSVLGRLRPAVTVEQARAELAVIMAQMPPDAKDPETKAEANMLPLKDVLTGRVAGSLYIFAGAVAFVLLIACVNVANLLLIRAASRRREMAVRVALGAGRGRIARQLLTESSIVGLAGGALGIVIAQVGVRALLAIAPAGRIPRLDEVHLDGWVLAFTIAVSLLTGVAFGLVPAIQGSRRPPREAMAHGTRTVGGATTRLRGALVAAEVALALVLLTGAGLMIKSFIRMRAADKGYDGSEVMTMAVDLPSLGYPDATRQKAFHARLMDGLAHIPGVRGVGAISWRPMGGVGMMGDFVVEGPSPVPHGFGLDKTLVSIGYFATMKVRLDAGRDFSVGDVAGAPKVVIVSRSVANRVWPGQDAIGKRVSMETDHPGSDSWMTVIGVVNDVVQDRSMEKHATMYFPIQQSDWGFILGHMTYVVRTSADATTARAMRAVLRDVDPTVPAQQLMSMDDALMDVAAEPVFETRLLSVFAAIALLLAAIGTYGVLAYDVAERTREIALRMALGATPANVVAMVMRRTILLAASGAAVGLFGALALTGVLTKSLYDVSPNDPATMLVVVLAIVGVALLAGFAPARRASRVHVLTAFLAD